MRARDDYTGLVGASSGVRGVSQFRWPTNNSAVEEADRRREGEVRGYGLGCARRDSIEVEEIQRRRLRALSGPRSSFYTAGYGERIAGRNDRQDVV